MDSHVKPWQIGFFACVTAFLLRLPFLLRYDLHFGGDAATCYLMSLRILSGDRPVYLYGQNYYGTLEQYAIALLFKWFGPSITLAGAFSLFEWALSVGLAVYLITKAAPSANSWVVGLVAAVAVPYTLHYAVTPITGYMTGLLFPMLLLWQAARLSEKGPSFFKGLLIGVILGLGWYESKQSLPGFMAVGLGLFLVPSEKFSRRDIFKPAFLVPVAVGAILGYAPEWTYRLGHDYRSFGGWADSGLRHENYHTLKTALLAYFDAQPISRIPEAIYFFINSDLSLIHAADWLDRVSRWLGILVFIYMAMQFLASLFKKNLTLVVMAMLVLLNMAAVVWSSATAGDFFAARRYMHPSAVAISCWTGLFFAMGLRRGFWIRTAFLILLVLFLGRVVWHEARLLNRPDELREFRAMAVDLKNENLKFGLAHWGHAYILDAITDQELCVAALDEERIPAYADQVAKQDIVAVIQPNSEPLPMEIKYHDRVYKPQGKPVVYESFRWVRYAAKPVHGG